MATYCKALRMNVIAWSQNLTAEKAEAAGANCVSKDELMATVGCDQHPHGAVGPQPRPDRGGRHRADEAGGDPDQHLARADRR